MLRLDTPFFVLEGIDGSGKGTQIQRVIQELEKHGKTVLILDYPRYEQKASFQTSQYLNRKYGKNIDAKAASILYAVDRFDDAYDVENGFIQKSQGVDFVIANRYTTSNMIHQTGKIRDAKEKKDFLDWLAEIEYESMKIPRPHKVFFLDVPPDIAMRNIEKKETRKYIQNNSNKDLHEEDTQHLKNAYESASLVIEHFWDEWQRVPCSQDWEMLSMEEITHILTTHILKYESDCKR